MSLTFTDGSVPFNYMVTSRSDQYDLFFDVFGHTTKQYNQTEFGYKITCQMQGEGDDNTDIILGFTFNDGEAYQYSELAANTDGWGTAETTSSKVNGVKTEWKDYNNSVVNAYKVRVGRKSFTGGNDNSKYTAIWIKASPDDTDSNVLEVVPEIKYTQPPNAWTPYGSNEPLSAYVLKNIVAKNYNKLSRANEQNSFSMPLMFTFSIS